MMSRIIVVLALLLNTAVSYHQQYRRWQRISTSTTPQATTETDTTSTSTPAIQTVLSVMDMIRKGDWDTKKHNNDVNTLLALAVEEKKLTLRILQKTNGPVPRSYLPTLMILDVVDKSVIDPVAVFALIEEGMKWYLDCGGRASRLEVSVPPTLVDVVQSMGFIRGQSQEEALQLRKLVSYPTDYVIMTCDAPRLQTHCEERGAGKKGASNPHVIYDIAGRLAHDMGDPKAAIKPYTTSLQAQPQSAAVFRNMGSAYHAAGDMQLAFASYQQAVQLDEADALVYLKLAFFYEDFASKDWIDAAEHSQKCYEYYLDKVDPGDTAVLTRLGNLLVREHKPTQAVSVFSRALDLDPGLENAWFNQAHAQMTIGDFAGASHSLRKTLEIDPSIIAARHMLKSLSEEEATTASASEEDYVKDLFDTYAQVYDTHVKKLLYSATRVIRQELATIYRSKHGLYDTQKAPAFSFTPLERAEIMKKEVEEEQRRKDIEMIELTQATDDGITVVGSSKKGAQSDNKEGFKAMGKVDDFKEALAPVGSSCSSYSSFMNSSLDILDIGCGTGLAGAWLKDYARSLVGVDLSEQMVNLARKKMLYQELHVESLDRYLQTCDKTFDLVVAADVLSYVGDLQPTFALVSKVLRPGGHFAFTVESTPEETVQMGRGYRLLHSGRFGYVKSYVDKLIGALQPSFTTPLAREFSPHLDAGEPVPGYLYIIQKDG